MIKIVGIIFIVVVLISSGSANIFTDIYDTGKKFVDDGMGKPNITLEKHHTEVGFPGFSGYPIDCTFTLKNTGDANGLATVDIETDAGQLLKQLVDLKVPKKTPSTYNVKFDMPQILPPSSDTIKYRIESQRSATSEEMIKALEDGINLLK